MNKRLSLILTAGIVLSLSIGCSMVGKKGAWQPIRQKETPVVHRVQYPKETFSIIAEWYTGSALNLESLENANPNINPDHLLPGNEIFVPEHLVKTREPMPEEFISKFYQTPKKNKAPEKSVKVPARKEPALLPKTEEEDEFEIFGPR